MFFFFKIWAAVLIVILLPTPLHAAGKTVNQFQHITNRNGLSQNSINCLLQDKRGFIWIGTCDGLNRYDGINFTIERLKPGDYNSLSSNYILSITEDRSGLLWIGTTGGLNTLNPKTHRFTRFRRKPGVPGSLYSDIINGILEDKNGTLWIGTENGLHKYNPGTNDFYAFRTDPADRHSISNNDVQAIFRDRAGTLWIGTNGGGLNAFDTKREIFTRYMPNPPGKSNIGSSIIRTITEDRNGNLWLGTDGGGLNKFDPRRKYFAVYKNGLADTHVRAVHEDRQGILWVGTSAGGLYTFDVEKETFTAMGTGSGNGAGVGSTNIRSIFEDASGILWIGTYDHGLSVYDGTRDKFPLYRKIDGNPNSLNHNIVWAICAPSTPTPRAPPRGEGVPLRGKEGKPLRGEGKPLREEGARAVDTPLHGSGTHSEADRKKISSNSRDIVWLGTDGGGLTRWDRESDTWTHFLHDPENPNSPSHNKIRVIHEGKPGILWLGTDGSGVDRFDTRTGEFFHLAADPNNLDSLIRNNIRALYYQHRTNTLWIGTAGGGLDKYIPAQNKFFHYPGSRGTTDGLSGNIVGAIYEDGKGTLWIGTYDGGLNRFNDQKENGGFTQYRNNPSNPHSLCGNGVMAIYEDRAGVLWIGTDSGLDSFNPATDSFIHYNTTDGLPNNMIYGILEESGTGADTRNTGVLWLSTINGLSRFNPREVSFKNYDESNGLQNNEFCGGAYFKNSKGEMFFGGLNGFNAFFPRDIKNNPYIPPVLFTGLSIFGRPVQIGEKKNGRVIQETSIWDTEEIVLSYKENVFSFDIAALHYSVPENCRYGYLMEGLDKKWRNIGRRRKISFANLPAGEYTLHVKGSNSDGIRNEKASSIKLTILPSPEELVNKTTLVLFIIFLLGGFYIVKYGYRLYQKQPERYLLCFQVYLAALFSWCAFLLLGRWLALDVTISHALPTLATDEIFQVYSRMVGKEIPVYPMTANRILPTLLSFPFQCLLVFTFIRTIVTVLGKSLSSKSQWIYLFSCYSVFLVLVMLGTDHIGREVGGSIYTIIRLNGMVLVTIMAAAAAYLLMRVKRIPEEARRKPLRYFAAVNLLFYIGPGILLSVDSSFSHIYLLPFLTCLAGFFSLYFLKNYSTPQPADSAAQPNGDKHMQQVFETYNFSSREREICALLVEGKTNKEIAELLYLSFYTVRTPVLSICKEVGTEKRVGWVR
ncbi:MAG: hypothetical protein GY765_27925, partial [bacterium]|nr:hypothetical protein [bacterium]